MSYEVIWANWPAAMGTPVNYLIPGERAEDVGGHEVGAAVPAGDPDGLHVVGVEHGEERVGDDVLQRLPPRRG
jgi:hypothetical protein